MLRSKLTVYPNEIKFVLTFITHKQVLTTLSKMAFNPLSDDKILDRCKLKQSADNLEFDENSRKFSKRVENTVGNGEIACYKAYFPRVSKCVIVWE